MSENSDRKTAKIYLFPIGGRRALLANADSKQAPDVSPPRPSKITLGGSWYHEAAIEDAELVRTR